MAEYSDDDSVGGYSDDQYSAGGYSDDQYSAGGYSDDDQHSAGGYSNDDQHSEGGNSDDEQHAAAEDSDDDQDAPSGYYNPVTTAKACDHGSKQTTTYNYEARPSEHSGSYQRTQKATYVDKQTGGFTHTTSKEVVSTGDTFKGRASTGRVGTKNEYMTTDTLRVGDKSGYSEYQVQQKFRTVDYSDRRSARPSSLYPSIRRNQLSLCSWGLVFKRNKTLQSLPLSPASCRLSHRISSQLQQKTLKDFPKKGQQWTQDWRQKTGFCCIHIRPSARQKIVYKEHPYSPAPQPGTTTCTGKKQKKQLRSSSKGKWSEG